MRKGCGCSQPSGQWEWSATVGLLQRRDRLGGIERVDRHWLRGRGVEGVALRNLRLSCGAPIRKQRRHAIRQREAFGVRPSRLRNDRYIRTVDAEVKPVTVLALKSTHALDRLVSADHLEHLSGAVQPLYPVPWPYDY